MNVAVKEPLQWIKAAEETFREAVESGDFRMAHAIADDTRAYGFGVEADYFEGIISRAKALKAERV